MACSIASITVYWIDASSFQAVVSGFANASLPCVLGSHLLFNLKELQERDVQRSASEDTMFSTDVTVSDMYFTSSDYSSTTAAKADAICVDGIELI